MEWYSLAFFTIPPTERTDNARYPNLNLTHLGDYLDKALAS